MSIIDNENVFILTYEENLKIMIDHLTAKYPYLKRIGFGGLPTLFGAFLYSYIFPGESLPTLAKCISVNIDNGLTNEEDILLGYKDKIRTERFDIYHKHQLHDFRIIQWASQFYGKSIDDLVNDVIKVCNYDNHVFQKIKSASLLDKFMHLVKCEILICLGMLFCYLKISMELEHWLRNDLICYGIIKHILDGSYNYDKLLPIKMFGNSLMKNRIAEMKKELLKKNPDIYYEDFYKDRLKNIYEMYHDQVRLVDKISRDPDEFGKFIDNNLDLSVLFSKAKYMIPYRYAGYKLLNSHLNYALAIPGLISRSENRAETSRPKLEPTLHHMADTQLLIEI